LELLLFFPSQNIFTNSQYLVELASSARQGSMGRVHVCLEGHLPRLRRQGQPKTGAELQPDFEEADIKQIKIFQ
jgi:hypothetical protein